jgi:hypothetical protein
MLFARTMMFWMDYDNKKEKKESTAEKEQTLLTLPFPKAAAFRPCWSQRPGAERREKFHSRNEMVQG